MQNTGRFREGLAHKVPKDLATTGNYRVHLIARQPPILLLPPLAVLGALAARAARRLVQQQRDERRDARTQAVVGHERILELVLAHHVLGELRVDRVLGPEQLHELGRVGRKVLC